MLEPAIEPELPPIPIALEHRSFGGVGSQVRLSVNVPEALPNPWTRMKLVWPAVACQATFEWTFAAMSSLVVQGVPIEQTGVASGMNANIRTIGELVTKSEAEMLKTKNFGHKSLNEIKEILREMGFELGMKIERFPSREEIEARKRATDKESA